MYDLTSQADAMVATLETYLSLGTVAFIDEDGQSDRYPVTMPAAFVVMEKLAGLGQENRSSNARVTWTVIVRGKQLSGSDGVLTVIDGVIDRLAGLQLVSGISPLQLLEVDYFDKQAESVAYAVRFLTKVKKITGSCEQ